MPLLFSYGTLQQAEVQQSTFHRLLKGTPDELVGYVLAQVKIDSPSVVATSGKECHPIARFSGILSQRVPGTVFELSEAELAQADSYEVAAYRRIQTTLASGKSAWVYVEVEVEPCGS